MAGIVDTSKDGLISLAEFQAFEGLLCVPDALYKTAFQLFDINGNGMVSFGKIFFFFKARISSHFFWFSDEFCEVIKKTTIHQRMPFDLNGGFIKLYFGREKKRVINYAEFSQFLHVRTQNSTCFNVFLNCRFRTFTRNTPPKLFED